MTEEQVDQLEDFESSDAYDQTEKNLLRFADQLTRNADVDEDVVESLKNDFSDRNLVELSLTVSIANMTNVINHTFDVPLEE